MSIVGVIALALFSALFARLWYLQVAATSEYAAAAQSNSVRVINEPPIRGRILDAKGRPLVDNRIAERHHHRPQALGREAARWSSPGSPSCSAQPAEAIRKKLDGSTRVSPYTPVPVAVDVTYDDARVRERAPRGLPRRARRAARDPRATRTAASAAHVLGYVGEINEEELDRAAAGRALRARRHDRQGRGRAHLRVRPARRAGHETGRGRRGRHGCCARSRRATAAARATT